MKNISLSKRIYPTFSAHLFSIITNLQPRLAQKRPIMIILLMVNISKNLNFFSVENITKIQSLSMTIIIKL